MGQTLTHGIYLPDEGERNCYNGLAANWSILDGAVGTVAEHTSQIAGKAPAVHTHTKSDITDFPAYGNAAGTICEGNDSRLSDARTPVAHTHGKADITDLLNSNFVPSANNSYDLGSSSYQWNNLYAKNYYYNGTAWGLDKANTWSGSNTYSGNVNLYNSDNTQNTPTLYLRNSKAEVSSSGNTVGNQGIYFTDKNNTVLAYVRGVVQSNGCVVNLKTFTKDASNNTVENGIQIGSFVDGSKWVAPTENGTIHLGGTSYKWKSLNGINPGALSLPDSIINLDTTNWNLTGVTFTYTPTVDGWLFINIQPDNNYAYVAFETGRMRSNSENTTGKNAMTFIAVRANIQVSITLNGASIAEARLVTCAGNV